MSRVLAGPFAGRMLSDLGADVVKLEPPDGDITRLWGRVVAGIPGYFHQQNAGKRNISVDLRAPGARELVFDLVRQADVLIENYRPGRGCCSRLGYEALREVNPRLVMLSISGFGRDGPESRRPAYAPIVHAELGLMARASRRGKVPNRDLPLSVADTNASLHGLVGLLSGPRAARADRASPTHRHGDGRCDHRHRRPDPLRARGVGEHPGTAQRHLGDGGATDPGSRPISAHLWRLLTSKLELPEPDTERVDLDTKIARRREAVDAFMRSLETWDQVEAAMSRMNVAWGQVRHGRTLREQPTIKHRGTIAEIDDRAGSTRADPAVALPVLQRFPSGVRGSGGAPRRAQRRGARRLARQVAEVDVAALSAGGVLHADAVGDAPGEGVASFDFARPRRSG